MSPSELGGLLEFFDVIPNRASSSPIRTTAAVSPSRNWPFSALNPAFSTSNSSYEGRPGTCRCSGTQRSKHVTNRINPHDTPIQTQLPHRPRARTDQPAGRPIQLRLCLGSTTQCCVVTACKCLIESPNLAYWTIARYGGTEFSWTESLISCWAG